MEKSIYYTEAEVDFLKENYNDYSTSELANILGRDRESISGKLRHLGLKAERELKPIAKGAKPDIKRIEEHIEELCKTNTLHPQYIYNLIDYWRGRIEKLKEEELKKNIKYSY